MSVKFRHIHVLHVLLLSSLLPACATSQEADETATTESQLSQPRACAVAVPDPGSPDRERSYVLSNVSPQLQQLFERWRFKASETEPLIPQYFSDIKVEKLIRSEGDHVVFQATAAIYTPAAGSRPKLHSWVVFVKGSSMRWLKGRFELPVGKSFLVNRDAGSAYPGSYSTSNHSYTWHLVADDGQIIDSVEGMIIPDFRRVAEDIVLASGPNGGSGYYVYVFRPDAIVHASGYVYDQGLRKPPEQLPCATHRGATDPWAEW